MLLSTDIISNIINKDYDEITRRTINLIKTQLNNAQAKGVVFGLSGGIDSAVLAYICKAEEEIRKNTLAIIMPDTTVTPESETEDAHRIISILGLEYKLIDISPIVHEYSMYLEPNKLSRANLCARIRSNILYYYANAKNRLVLGSSDKSEYMIGYFTKYGDGASDVMPIVTLYKTQVRELARHLKVPDKIIEKKSNPFLQKDGKSAEEEIGATYEDVDAILWCMIEKGMSIQKTAQTLHIDIEIVQKIAKMNQKSKHKRDTPVREESGQQSHDI